MHALKAASTTPAPATACPKCVTNDAGKRTCCARGGGWYPTCGKKGDSKADHTWDEGLQACQNPAPGQAHAQVMLINQTTTSQLQIISATDSTKDVHDSYTANSREHVTLSDPTIVISLFLVLPLFYV